MHFIELRVNGQPVVVNLDTVKAISIFPNKFPPDVNFAFVDGSDLTVTLRDNQALYEFKRIINLKP